MIYTLTLNPALDYALTADNLRFGEINRASVAAFRFGGKGINVSAMLARLGVESAALGFVGGFTGRKLAELCKAEGINCYFTELSHGETRVNVKLRSADELDVNAPGPAITDGDVDALCAKLAALGAGDTLVFSGSVPTNAPPDAAKRIFEAASDRGARLAVDTYGDALAAALPYRPFVVKPNHVELGEFFGESAETPGALAALAAKLRSTDELDVNAPGPGITDGDLDALCVKLAALGDGDTLVFSGSVPPNAPPDAAKRIFAAVAERGVRLAVDACGATLAAALGYRPFVVKPNHVELGEFFGESAETPGEIAALAAKLRDAGARNVLVSRAENGAMLFPEDGSAYSVGVVRGSLVDSACCGDAMLAGFFAGYDRTGDFAEALRLGAACGNATAFCDGLANAAGVSGIYEKLAVESI